MDGLLLQITSTGQALLGPAWPVVWNLVKIILVVLPLLGCVAYLTLWERKMIGFMHIRLGPNRVGPFGLLQPIADAFKLMLKEIIVPSQANSVLYLLAPVMTTSLTTTTGRPSGSAPRARRAVGRRSRSTATTAKSVSSSAAIARPRS